MLLFVIVPMTALATWSVVKYSQIKSQKEAVAWVEQQNGHVIYEYERPTADGSHPVDAKPPGPKFLREWIGMDAVSGVYGVILDNQEVTDLTPLTGLTTLEYLGVFIEVSPNANLTELTRLKHLRVLHFAFGDIDKEQLDQVEAALPNCDVHIGENVRVR